LIFAYTINRLTFADDLVLLSSSEQDLNMYRFPAEDDLAAMKISAEMTEVLFFFRIPSQCTQQISGSAANRVIQVPRGDVHE